MLKNKRPHVIHICLFHVVTIILSGCQCTSCFTSDLNSISDWQTRNYILPSAQAVTGLILYCYFGLGAAFGRSGPGFSSTVPDESVPSGTPLVSHPHRRALQQNLSSCHAAKLYLAALHGKHPIFKKGKRRPRLAGRNYQSQGSRVRKTTPVQCSRPTIISYTVVALL